MKVNLKGALPALSAITRRARTGQTKVTPAAGINLTM
jgi:hypothetical protein